MSEIKTTAESSTTPTVVDETLYNKVQEGKALVYFNKTKNEVFYNPVQEFNRDLSIAVLNTYSATNENKQLRILEALAASGIRSMRYALEVDNCKEVVANDFDRKAVELININRALNGVSDRVTASCDDAILLMGECSRQKNTHFDCIDLDPYGTPAAFLDSAIRSVRSGGLLLITATDAGVLCGNGSDTCFTKYGSVSLRTPSCHELALRILLQSLNSHAVRYSKYIVPVISLSIDFYFRLFVRVFDGQLQAKESINNIGFFHICCECHSFFKQSYGHTVPTNGNVKFIHANKQPFDLNKCGNCGGGLKMVGPVWTGKLHDKTFIKATLDHVESKTAETYKTISRMKGMLNVVLEETDDPLYYVLDEISSVMHSATPNHDMITSAILNAKYQVSYSHCQRNSIKTNAPTQFVWDVLRRFVKDNPIKDKWLVPEHRVFHIMQKPAEHEIDFTIRKECMPHSKRSGLVRYQEPPPFWGPGSKPGNNKPVEKNKSKRKAEDQNNASKEKINKIEKIEIQLNGNEEEVAKNK